MQPKALLVGECDDGFIGRPLVIERVVSSRREAPRVRLARLKARSEALWREVRRVAGEDMMKGRASPFDLGDAYESEEHCLRVGAYVEVMGERMGVPPTDALLWSTAAVFHDFGKISVDPAILRKTSGLTTDERLAIQEHAPFGGRRLSQADSPVLLMAAMIAETHHEAWDGSGYPLGLKGEEIPYAARLTTLADVYDALRSRRAYKEPFSHKQAMDVILRGNQRTKPENFDPVLLEVFQKCAESFAEIFGVLGDNQLNTGA